MNFTMKKIAVTLAVCCLLSTTVQAESNQNYQPANEEAGQKQEVYQVQKGKRVPLWKSALKELYGKKDHNGKVKTAKDKLSSVWFEQSFQDGNDKAHVIFIKTQSLINGEISECYACSAEIGAVTYKQKNDKWQIVSKQRKIGDIGHRGDAPRTTQAEILQLLPDKFVFMIGYSDSHQGFDYDGKQLLDFSKNNWRLIGFVYTAENNESACAADDTHCYNYEGKISVVSGNKEYPDLLVTKTGTEEEYKEDKTNVIPAKNAVYVFNGDYYEDLNDPNT